MVLISARAARAGAIPRGAATLLVALALLAPGVAHAVEPPAPGALPVLGARCDSAGLVRVVTHRSTRIVHRLQLDAGGVVLLGPGRTAFIELGMPPEKRPTLLPWSDIESLSLGRSRAGRGLLGGALVGAVVGGGLVATLGPDVAEENDHVVVFFAAVLGLGFAGLGFLLGAGNPAWTPLYP